MTDTEHTTKELRRHSLIPLKVRYLIAELFARTTCSVTSLSHDVLSRLEIAVEIGKAAFTACVNRQRFLLALKFNEVLALTINACDWLKRLSRMNFFLRSLRKNF